MKRLSLRCICRNRRQNFFRIQQFESRKWALWVSRGAFTLMFSVHSGTNVLVQSIRIAQTIIQPENRVRKSKPRARSIQLNFFSCLQSIQFNLAISDKYYRGFSQTFTLTLKIRENPTVWRFFTFDNFNLTRKIEKILQLKKIVKMQRFGAF